MFRSVCIVVIGASLAGCALWGQEEPEDKPAHKGPIQPIEVFEQTKEPRREYPGREDPDGLSRDIERLQDARREYENERAREAAEARRRQEECREMEGSQQVPIEDGSGSEEGYCQPPPPDGSADGQ